MAHTNGLASFWSMLKRAYHGTYPHVRKKHLPRYVHQFADKRHVRTMDTLEQMPHVVAGMVAMGS